MRGTFIPCDCNAFAFSFTLAFSFCFDFPCINSSQNQIKYSLEQCIFKVYIIRRKKEKIEDVRTQFEESMKQF